MCLEPSWLHLDLRFLLYGHAEACTQFNRARDYLPSIHRAGQARGFSGRRRPATDSFRATLRAVSNVVFMGMGEPLYNFENVRDALAVFSDGEGLSLSKRRITVSTAGVVPRLGDLAARPARCSPFRCMRCATSFATAWCRSTGNIRSGPACGLQDLPRRVQRAAHHLRICDAEGDQRFARRREGAGPLAQRRPGQDQFDSFQSVARHAFRMFGRNESRIFQILSSTPVMRAPCERRADATFSRPAASSRAKRRSCGRGHCWRLKRIWLDFSANPSIDEGRQKRGYRSVPGGQRQAENAERRIAAHHLDGLKLLHEIGGRPRVIERPGAVGWPRPESKLDSGVIGAKNRARRKDQSKATKAAGKKAFGPARRTGRGQRTEWRHNRECAP